MSLKLNSAVRLLVILCLVWENTSKFEWTNLKCTAVDKNFTAFEYCHIKPINRTYKYISFKAILFQTPVTKIKINFAVFKRLNGYVPFLYNVTVDSCRFLENPNRHPIANFFYQILRTHSNMNHSCPYNHDLVLDKLTIADMTHQFTNVLPVPEGHYLVQTNWMAYGVLRATIGFYGNIY